MVPPTEQQVVAQAKKDVGWDIGSGGGGDGSCRGYSGSSDAVL